ncbi:LysR family transcriptional regulator [uncultured Paraglaciecola sp.]|uniref:LysR family transcriptional regulator n=1 Tax=uncultured Paraglaciecola sp. TaxID=1765024 RepID=UPI00260AD107|nr:LysR family transcriptional regulator [uncultured Paraglaciecola sp.]
MRLRHIEIFHAIYTTGSITNAAKLLYVSQPSVSKVLAHAEQQLGFQLFKRAKGKLIPTAEANMLFSDVDKIYKQIHSIRKMSENIQHSADGLVNIALSPALGFDLLPKAIAKFRQRHPKVRFKLQTLHNEEALQALIEHKCDLALLYSSPSMPGVKELDLGESEMVVLYPDEVFPHKPEKLAIEDLADTELIGIWGSGPLGDLVWNHLARSNIQIKSSLQVDTYFIAAKLVSQGLGCCTIDKYTALGNLSDNTSMASFEPSLPIQLKGLYLDSQPLPRVCEEFTEFVKTEVQQVQALTAITQGYE